eukprot:12929236-Prorocentrum_lima.AAC.1
MVDDDKVTIKSMIHIPSKTVQQSPTTLTSAEVAHGTWTLHKNWSSEEATLKREDNTGLETNLLIWKVVFKNGGMVVPNV